MMLRELIERYPGPRERFAAEALGALTILRLDPHNPDAHTMETILMIARDARLLADALLEELYGKDK